MSIKTFNWNLALTNQMLMSSSLSEYSLNKKNSEVDNGEGDNIKKGLKDNNGGVELEFEDFRLVQKDDASEYLQGVREYSLSTIEKHKRKRKRK